jgi:hypothetical protein
MSSIKLRCLDDSGNNIFLVDSNSGIKSTNTIESINSTVGAITLSGGISIHKTSNSSSITAGGALTIAGGASFGKDVHIGGNLTVYGTQTQIISQIIRIQDNLLVVNSAPNTSRDGGILFQRYQIENDTDLGDIVKDIPTSTFIISDATTNTITFPISANVSNDYYTNWFVKITSGVGIDQVRQITSYDGTTKIATLNSSFTITPITNDTVDLFNKVYASYFYSEASDNFVLGWTTDDPESSSVSVSDYIGLQSGHVHIFNTQSATGLGSGGSFTALGGASISKNLYVGDNSVFSTNVTISNTLYSQSIYTENQNVNTNLTVGNTITTTNMTCDFANVQDLTSNNLTITSITNSNLLNTNSTITNLLATSITSNSATLSNSTITNASISNLHPSNLITDKESSHTLGSIITTGGNVGINIISPNYHLDVNGNVHVNADLYVDGIISGGVGTSSTFAYLTLTSTDESINLSTGSLLTYGGLTIQSIADAESVTNGGSILTEGGAAIGKKLFVGGNLIALSNSNTIGNIFTTGGNVGINKANPSATLQIDGYCYIGNSTPTDTSIYSQLTLTPVSTQLGETEINFNTSSGKRNWIYANSTSGLYLGGYGDCYIQPNTTTTAIFSTSGKLVLTSTTANIEMSPTNNNFGSIETYLYTDNTQKLPLVFNPYGGNVGIGTTSPIFNLHVSGPQFIESTQNVGNFNITSVSGGALNVSGDIVVSGTRGMYFTNHGINPPTFTSRSLGSKIILYSDLSANSCDYALGIDTSSLWFSVPKNDNNLSFKWFHGTTNTMSLEPQGSLQLKGTTNSQGVATGGTLTVLGGTAISKDLHIGGNIYVNGQNMSIISGNTTIGNYTGTGVMTISNISIGTTMGNTNYKIIGSLNTTTNNTNVYTVNFKSITTTTFDAVIYRIDSLGSGWTDTLLTLSWQIIP